MLRILAVSGSLRARSTSTEVLRAATLVAPASIRVDLYDGLADLPQFNPDLDGEDAVPPPAVKELRSRVAAANALLICSPEYAHGVPGSLKNALDWLVSGPEMVSKPVGVINASPRSTHAHESLIETLSTMSADVVPGASLTLPVNSRRMDAATIAADSELAPPLVAALAALGEAARI